MSNVSVIIPTFNRAKLLPGAIESLLAQTLHDSEVIVVDDGSTDETQRVIQKYGNQVRYIRISHSGLPAIARNVGIRAASRGIIAFLDSDDEWLPEKLAKQVAILGAQAEVGLVCANAYLLEADQAVPSRLLLRPGQGSSGNVFPYLLRDNFVITSTVLVRRSLLDRVGLMDESRTLKAVEDYDLWLRLAAVTDICYLDEPLAVYKDFASSVRSDRAGYQHWQAKLTILEQIAVRYPDAYQLNRGIFVQMASIYRSYLVRAYLDEGLAKKALRKSLWMIRQEPTDLRGYLSLGRSIKVFVSMVSLQR